MGNADPFVIAVARVRKLSVVTGEKRRGNLARPKIPDVCDAFWHPQRIRENTLPQGVYINYRLTGTGDSVIVALHGFGGSLDTWNGIEPFLSADHRFYAIDLPGFGLSAHPRHFGYTLKEQSEAVAAFLQFVHDENPGRKITLMGHSFGGSIAIATAVLLLDRRKALVDSLILIDALGFPQIVHLPLSLNILRVPVLSHLVLHLVPARSLARSALRSGMYRRDRVTNEQVCQFAQFINVPGGHDSLVRTIQQIRTPEAVELSARIPEIQIPTLIVWGSHDSLLSPDQAELLHRALPAARPVFTRHRKRSASEANDGLFGWAAPHETS